VAAAGVFADRRHSPAVRFALERRIQRWAHSTAARFRNFRVVRHIFDRVRYGLFSFYLSAFPMLWCFEGETR
jgi:hypothetical protein